jgi:hypothetical protein
MQEACSGMDTVVHLAAFSRLLQPFIDFHGILFRRAHVGQIGNKL